MNRRARHERRRKAAAIITIIAMLGLVAGTLAFASSNGTTTSTQASSTTTTSTLPVTTTTLDPSKLPPVGQDLYTLIQAGRASQYHVRYLLSGTAVPTTATTAILEVWRSADQVRQETRLEEPTGVTHSINIGGPSGTVACQEQPNVALSCQQVSTDPLRPDDDFLASITDRLGAAATIDVAPSTVDDLAARCFVLDAADTTNRSEVCLTDAGVPLRVDSGGLTATADAVDTAVDPSVFVPPAPVSGAPTIESTVITAPPTASS